MSIFYFHLHECGTVFSDEEGIDLPDFESATIMAIHEAREIMAAEVRHGSLCLSCHIEIESEAGGARRIVPFSDVLTVKGLPSARPHFH